MTFYMTLVIKFARKAIKKGGECFEGNDFIFEQIDAKVYA